MQDRYVGDIGDYVKYGLLRALSSGRRLGVAWYLHPDEDHNEDGRHIDYLAQPERWRSRDPALFDVLNTVVTDNRRKVAAIETSGILGDAKFSGERLQARAINVQRRGQWRSEWFGRVTTELADCDLIFADPDNGLCEDERYSPGRPKMWKRMPLAEAKALAANRTAVLYHHNTRRAGGHEREIAYWVDQLGPGTVALRWRAYSSRTFFVVNPAPGMAERVKMFAEIWGPKAQFCE